MPIYIVGNGLLYSCRDVIVVMETFQCSNEQTEGRTAGDGSRDRNNSQLLYKLLRVLIAAQQIARFGRCRAITSTDMPITAGRKKFQESAHVIVLKRNVC